MGFKKAVKKIKKNPTKPFSTALQGQAAVLNKVPIVNKLPTTKLATKASEKYAPKLDKLAVSFVKSKATALLGDEAAKYIDPEYLSMINEVKDSGSQSYDTQAYVQTAGGLVPATGATASVSVSPVFLIAAVIGLFVMSKK